MTRDSSAFFTLDRGTAATTATLIAPVDGRYRMLAAATAPVPLDPDSVLEDLAWRVARTDASLAGSMEGWRDWSRLEVATNRAPRAVLVAASAETGDLASGAFRGAGWSIEASCLGADVDVVALGEACIDPTVDAVVMAGRDGVEEDELETARRLWALVGSLARFRDDLAVIACGPFAKRPEGIAEGRLFSLPAPDPLPLTAETLLRTAAQQVGTHLVARGEPVSTDGRAALRASVASLAALLGDRVDGVEIGVAAASRTLAADDGSSRHAVIAGAGMLPRALLDDEDLGDAVVRWSTLPGDPVAHLDTLRELVVQPWAHSDADGVRLRMAALRSALERLDTAWSATGLSAHAATAGSGDAADVVVLSGGAFAAVPAAAAILALVDGIRRTGAQRILHDHAGVLAPLGALPVEDDRRRLLGDLMDDCLLPLGSTLLTGAPSLTGRKARPASMHVSSTLGEEHMILEPDVLRLVDLPPGISARLEVDPGDASIPGVEDGPRSIDVRGGLGGLLVDTRPIPLELPGGGEARRTALVRWEAPAWLGHDR